MTDFLKRKRYEELDIFGMFQEELDDEAVKQVEENTIRVHVASEVDKVAI